MKNSDGHLLRLIALFKLVKAALLIATGIGAMSLKHRDVGALSEQWASRWGLDPGNRFVSGFLEKATHLTPGHIKGLGIVSFVYAGLFLTEGIGLWLQKGWAEWFTIAITTSLIPVEIYEIHRHPSVVKVIVLAINVAVVGYLVYRVRHRGDAR